MPRREERRDLQTIPVGSLGIIPLRGYESFAEKVDSCQMEEGKRE